MATRHLPIQFRVYPDAQAEHKGRPRLPINQILIDDTETTTDPSQRLIFGSGKLQTVRENVDGTLTRFTVREVLYYADDLETFRPRTFKALQEYCRTHDAGIDYRSGQIFPTFEDTEHGQLDIEPHPEIEFLSHSEYVENYVLKSGYSTVPNREYQPATIVGYNLSFDMWRHITRVMPAQGWYYGGLSGEFLGGKSWTPNYRELKAGIGMKREMTKVKASKLQPAYLLDLAQLVRALTGKPHTLLSAGKAYGCRVLKYDGPEVHDPEVNYTGDDLDEYLQHYIAYNRNDVDATAELWEKATIQFLRHPIQLRSDLAFSPASISKQYIRDMGIHAPMCGCQNCVKSRRGGRLVPLEIMGRCMTAFYGGRAECRIRLENLPVVLCDWTSMYPTIMILSGIWEMLVAERIECRDETAEVQEFLDRLTMADLLRPETWPKLCGIAEFIPNDDLGPVRSPYADTAGSAAGIGINHLTADRPVTWTLADLAANKILTGNVPRLDRAWRFYPSKDKQTALKPISLFGNSQLEFNPRTDNLLKFLVEQRQIAKGRHKTNKPDKPARHFENPITSEAGDILGYWDCDCPYCDKLRAYVDMVNDRENSWSPGIQEVVNDSEFRQEMADAGRQAWEVHRNDNLGDIWNANRNLCLCEACEIEQFLKVDANAIYGVFAEMNRNARAEPKPGTVYGQEGESWPAKDPEMPGEFCFPPFACVITGGARLMLAMAEKMIRDQGSMFVFCDTDSVCIPASRSGKTTGQIPVLSYRQVDEIRRRINRLNPYDRQIVPELVKWEYPERDGDKFPARPIYAAAISAKRYALYTLSHGEPDSLEITDSRPEEIPEIEKRSEHGLGLYVNPLVINAADDKDARNGNWYEQAWRFLISKYVLKLDAPEPDWFDFPAVSRFPVRALAVWEAFKDYNHDRRINEQVIPFNFFLAFHASRSAGVFNFDQHSRLIAPFNSNPAEWLDSEVIDMRTGERFHITTDPDKEILGERILVKSYREVLWEYLTHPEFKYDDSKGNPCGPFTRGILSNTHVSALSYQHITKDSSSVTTAAEAFVHDGPFVYRDDGPIRRRTLIREVLRSKYSTRVLAEKLGVSHKVSRNIISSTSSQTSYGEIEKAALALAVKHARADLRDWNMWALGRKSELQVLTMWHRAREIRRNRDA